jgi:hypothetical protein
MVLLCIHNFFRNFREDREVWGRGKQCFKMSKITTLRSHPLPKNMPIFSKNLCFGAEQGDKTVENC